MATSSYQNRCDQKNERLNSYQGDKTDLTHQNTTEHIISTHFCFASCPNWQLEWICSAASHDRAVIRRFRAEFRGLFCMLSNMQEIILRLNPNLAKLLHCSRTKSSLTSLLSQFPISLRHILFPSSTSSTKWDNTLFTTFQFYTFCTKLTIRI